MHVRDTYQHKLLHPPQVDPPVTFAAAPAEDPALPLKGPPRKQEQAIIFQMEKELARIRERQLQDQMAYEEKMGTMTVDERFSQTLTYLNLLADALWKMPQAKSVVKEIKDALVSQFHAKDQQFKSFERGVEGQFELFKDKLEEQ